MHEAYDEELQVSKKILEKLRVFQTFKVNADYFFSSDFDIDFNLIRLAFEEDRVADRLADDHYSDEKDLYFDIPETTWQMFKHRSQEKWWMRRFVAKHPVRYVTHSQTAKLDVHVTRYLTYPEAEIRSSRLGRAFPFETVEVN